LTRCSWLAAVALLSFAVPVPAATLPGPPSPTAPVTPDGPAAGGRLLWSTGDRLDLIGDLWADLPVAALGDRCGLFVSLLARTAIEGTSGGDFELNLQVRDLDYAIDLGWRRRAAVAGRPRLSVFAGQSGKEKVDAPGQPYVRYLAVGLESDGFTRAPALSRNLRWRLATGPVWKEREVSADVFLRGRLAWDPLPSGRWAGLRLDLRVNGLIDGGRFDADWSGGPSLVVAVPGGRELALFAHYQLSDNPLGIGEDAWLLGVEYREGAASTSIPGGAPEISGEVAAGAGEGRIAGIFRLQFVSPDIVQRVRAVLDVEGNILTARDTGELYYLYHLGLERPVRRYVAGAYLYHRSNHRLAEPGDGFTSLNVLEIGLETKGWRRTAQRVSTWTWGQLEARARAGYLINSSFGEERRWHLRGGVRWTVPWTAGGTGPYVLLEGEFGDVERRSYGFGVVPLEGLAFQLEYREDDQYFGADQTAVLITTRYGF